MRHNGTNYDLDNKQASQMIDDLQALIDFDSDIETVNYAKHKLALLNENGFFKENDLLHEQVSKYGEGYSYYLIAMKAILVEKINRHNVLEISNNLKTAIAYEPNNALYKKLLESIEYYMDDLVGEEARKINSINEQETQAEQSYQNRLRDLE